VPEHANPPAFDDFVRPLIGVSDPEPAGDVLLHKLAAGEYAVLAWLDDVQANCSPAAEAELIARWDSLSLRDVYHLIYPGTDLVQEPDA
jgi:hypothetical protein